MKKHRRHAACGGFTERNEIYDAYVCLDCDVWTEKVCDDPKCEFCSTRPEKPSQIQQETRLPRLLSGISNFDRVLYGGFVPGSTAILSSPPGVGKTTLMMQVLDGVAKQMQCPVMIVSGEQRDKDINEIAARIGAVNPLVTTLGEHCDVLRIIAEVKKVKPALLVIDSIHTTYLDSYKSEAGSAFQIKASTRYLAEFANAAGIAIVFIGHVTRDGDLAAPKYVEHLVDTVLELDPATKYDPDGNPIAGTENHVKLRVEKNRHGESRREALFRMTADGLKGVSILKDV